MNIFCSVVWLLLQLVLSDAFLLVQPRRTSRISNRGRKIPSSQHTKQLYLSSSNDSTSSFDISKPVFDFYSFRSIRGDALAKYNSLNQSEPLRINLAALAMLTCMASPWLVPELSSSSSSLTLPQGIAAASLAVLSGGAFVRECQRRSKQLTRLEKELEALDLFIKLPSNLLADAPFRTAATVRELLKALSIRLVVVRGTAQELSSTLLQELQVLGRRLSQANAYVVIVPTDGSTKTDWGLSATTRYSWLAEPESIAAWNKYFDDTLLASSSTTTTTTSTASDDSIAQSVGTTASSFRWFGLKPNGRTFGSGTTPPSWLQVMGRNILPTAVLDEKDPAVVSENSEQEQAILECQQRFYTALTTGNAKLLKEVYYDQSTEAVDRVIQDGGRMDTWETCLADGARPEGMKVADADVTIVSDTLAYSTIIEFPAMIQGSTLLAVQTWTRGNSDEDWKLQEHQTIPWSDSPAGGTLICDCRGCVSLVRSPERRTFGGLIG